MKQVSGGKAHQLEKNTKTGMWLEYLWNNKEASVTRTEGRED